MAIEAEMSEKQNRDHEEAEYARRFLERVRQSARLHRATK